MFVAVMVVAVIVELPAEHLPPFHVQKQLQKPLRLPTGLYFSK